jgi:hypothetical protein
MMQFSPVSCYFFLLRSKCLLSFLLSNSHGLFLPKCFSPGFTSALDLYFFVFKPHLLPNRQPKHSQYFSPLALRCRSNQDISSAVWGLCAVRDV